MAKMRYSAVKTELWGVFVVSTLFESHFRTLKAAFSDETAAKDWAKKYSADNFGIAMMVEEIKVTIPAWDGMVPNPIVTNPLEA